MRGSRPLSREEVRQILEAFDGPYKIRNRALLTICLNTGARVSETLAIRIDQVWQKDTPTKYLSLEPSQTKSRRSRTIPLNGAARWAVAELMAWKKIAGQDCAPLGLVKQPVHTTSWFPPH